MDVFCIDSDAQRSDCCFPINLLIRQTTQGSRADVPEAGPV